MTSEKELARTPLTANICKVKPFSPNQETVYDQTVFFLRHSINQMIWHWSI